MKFDGQSIIDADKIEQAIRQKYSPFPELSMELISQQLNAFRIGELRPAARTWEIMYERDGELSGPADKRFADCARLDWEVMAIDESPEAMRHKEALEYFFNNLRTTSVLDQDESGDVRLLISQAMTAHAYRYSVHEMVLRIDSAAKKQVSAQFRHCPVYFFESRRGRLGYLREEFALYGEPLLPGEWFTMVGRGLMRQCSIAYAVKHFPLRDWLLFCARFGVPGIHGKTDAAKGTPEWDAFIQSLQAFANDWITATNKGAEISLIESAKGAASLPFKDLVERTDRLYSKLFRGSDLATSALKDGVGADIQQGETNIFLEDDADWFTDGANERIVRPVIAYLFNTTPKAWFRLITPKKDTVERDLKTAEFLAKYGYRISAADAGERLGWAQAEEGEQILQTTGSAAGPSDEETTALGNAKDENEVFSAFADDLQPVLDAIDERIERIIAIEDKALRVEKFNALWEELAPLRKDIKADPSAARALETVMAKAFEAGLKTKK